MNLEHDSNFFDLGDQTALVCIDHSPITKS